MIEPQRSQSTQRVTEDFGAMNIAPKSFLTVPSVYSVVRIFPIIPTQAGGQFEQQ